MLCPCGSASEFDACCHPLISTIENEKPKTAEQLMRSRFSAYARKDAQYIFDTYSAAQQVKQSLTDIKSWADKCIWIALEVHNTTKSTVDFSAYYIAGGVLCELREKSNFVIEQGNWRYVDGDITVNNEITPIKRNQICPCNNYPTAWPAKKGKKFKHCCGK